MKISQNFCADCQHLRMLPQSRHPHLVCASSEFASDPVTGGPAVGCVLERGRPTGLCGVDGNLFEQRDPATWVSWVSRPGPLLDAKYTL